VLEVVYHHARSSGVLTSNTAGEANNVEFLSACLSVCLSACLSVTLLKAKFERTDFAQKPLELRSGFDIIGYVKVCRCAPTFNFVSMPLNGAITGC